MTELDRIRQKKAEILRIAEKHGAANLRLFGSVARKEENARSDIDILVTKKTKTSPWFPAGLVLDLEELLGRRVEVVTEKGINTYLRDRVLREAIPL